MTRYDRLCPPPWCRVVMRPWLLRPPFFGSGRVSDFSGVVRVMSAKSATDEPRRPDVVGLCLRIAMFSSSYPSGARSGEDVDALALGHAHDGALGVSPLTPPRTGAATLTGTIQRVHADDLDVEDLLDGDLDLRLVGIRSDDEGVLVLVEQSVTLLAHDRRDQHIARVSVQRGHLAASFAPARSTNAS